MHFTREDDAYFQAARLHRGDGICYAIVLLVLANWDAKNGPHKENVIRAIGGTPEFSYAEHGTYGGLIK